MPFMRLIDPERAHGLALKALALGLAGADDAPDSDRLTARGLGMRFSNPIGLAAGFDKDAAAVLPLMRLGFGFVEAGTVTPLPQAGNPRPRLFRLPKHRAIINRMGFNNSGLDAYLEAIRKLSARPARFGANVGINKTGADPERDYPALVRAVAPFSDYVVINVSSPNTPGLRDLQGERKLRDILTAIGREVPVRPPLLVKIAPDLADYGLRAVVDLALEVALDGLIVANTTISRPPSLAGQNARQAGGLSGAPLWERSTEMLRTVRRLVGPALTLIGCGGIATGADILAKIEAGADLVQVYTAFAYAGPALVPRLKHELLAALDERGHATLRDAAASSR